MQKIDGERQWADEATFRNCIGKGITAGANGITLRRGVTIADEMGRCNRNDVEIIKGLRQAKKRYQLPAINAAEAQLCPYLTCDDPDGELELIIKGNSMILTRPEDRDYWDDRWTRIPVPSNWLKEGDNEVIFRSVGEAAWNLLIEDGRQPDRSEVSEDGGQTWRSDDLGENDRTDGEYMVRLWLDQHVASGDALSDPVDVLATAASGGVAPAGNVESFKLIVDATTPADTQISLQWRGGPTPVYDPATWSAWANAEGDITPGQGLRWVQWRASLRTTDPSVSPALNKVSLKATIVASALPETSVIDSDNPSLSRSPYRFSYLSSDAKRGERLRERWKLDEVIRPAKTEFEAYLHLRNWVREQWEDGWNMGEIDFCPPWDAMVILELASRKLSLGMCTHYATVMSHCSAALGLVARTQIMHAHCINEVWSGEHGKWVAMDVGGDANDETKFTYHFERDGVPMSALDAHRAHVEKDFGNVTIVPQPPPAVAEQFSVEKRLALFDRFMISLRNDELMTMGPGEPEHGKISYHYDGYLFWQDEETEPLPWFSQNTSRAEDIYWTVNRAVVHLQQSEEAGSLRIDLETETPNFKCFEVSVNEGDWEQKEASFTLVRSEGEMHLAVRPVNAFGRKGTESWVKVRS